MISKILITEDHALYRDGLHLLLRQAFCDAQIIEAGDLSTALNLLELHPDISLALLDIQLPDTHGLDGLITIKTKYPALPLIVVSTIDYQASVQQMLQAGADGFIAKTSSKATIIEALKNALNGEITIVGRKSASEHVALSPRQINTLELLALGLSNKEIASKLNISPATVKEYVADLRYLFDCSNRTQVVLKAKQMGFILD